MINQDGVLARVLDAGETVAMAGPYPRVLLDHDGWRGLTGALSGAELVLLAQWAEADTVHAALRDDQSGAIAVVSLVCPDHRFASLGAVRPSAIRPERAIRDLWGLEPEGNPDGRPWLDHGRWPRHHPLAARPATPAPAPSPHLYPFLPAEGEGLHQIPVGPVHAGVIEPGHFRFHAQGEAVVRLEARLGYVHKGIAALAAGQPVPAVARLAGRVSGDSTVAYALAFARAVEAATGTVTPRRADWLRALLAELERLANHLHDIGGVCNDAAFAVMLARMMVLRERVLAVNRTLFGHRLLMDRVVPGGVAVDLGPGGAETIKRMVFRLGKDIDAAQLLYENTPSLSDRTQGTGILSPALAHRFGAGGYIGRASGRGHDARRTPGYPPYDLLDLSVPMLREGDVNARVMIRFAEARESLRLINRILLEMPPGPVLAGPGPAAGEGLALVESFRGEVLAWVRVGKDSRVAALHLHDPSWFQWPLLEAAIKDNIVADFPLCNKSFNCSYSGHDL